MRTIWNAFSFLTILPVKNPEEGSPEDLGRAVVWFPFVGLWFGGILYGIRLLLDGVVPEFLLAALILAVWVLLSGGLHLDGLADCLDGLLAAVDRERRLTILRDTHVGAFAVIGLSMTLILKTAALTGLPDSRWLLFVPVLGRFALVLGALQPSARQGGLAAMFKSGINRRRVLAAFVLPLVLAGLLGVLGFVFLFVALAAAMLVFWFARRQIGGVTGDVLGAACEFVELAVLTGLAML